jgi:hypothetical protein
MLCCTLAPVDLCNTIFYSVIEVPFCTVVYRFQDNFITTCHSGLVVRVLDLSPEVPGSNLLLEANKFPPSTYSQT